MSRFTRWAQAERSPGVRIVALALAGILFLGLIPLLISVVGPSVDGWIHLDGLEPSPASLAVGGILVVVGVTFALWSVVVQVTRGRGTPLPMLPTQGLLTAGPFRYCRNPMTLGTVLAYLGLSIAAATATGTAFVLVFGGSLVLYLKRVEEKELAERFGEDYAAYRRAVPFIIPCVRRRRSKILLALGVGAALIGVAAALVEVTDLTDFYAACFWLGLVVDGPGGSGALLARPVAYPGRTAAEWGPVLPGELRRSGRGRVRRGAPQRRLGLGLSGGGRLAVSPDGGGALRVVARGGARVLRGPSGGGPRPRQLRSAA